MEAISPVLEPIEHMLLNAGETINTLRKRRNELDASACAGGCDHQRDGTQMIEQLQQLCTVTWDGNIISKSYRDSLVDAGYADKLNGFNFITANGLIVLANLQLLPKNVKP
jgi:hypothetical protein